MAQVQRLGTRRGTEAITLAQAPQATDDCSIPITGELSTVDTSRATRKIFHREGLCMENILWEPITIIHVEVVTVSVGHLGLQISLSYYAPLQETNTSLRS